MMFRLSSERQRRLAFASAVAGLLLAAFAFLSVQNSGMLPGGSVAPVKLAWLSCAILFWYLLPALLLADSRLPDPVRFACGVLLANMLARAVVELFMMYVSKNWHPWFGIGHDVFTAILMFMVSRPVFRSADLRFYGGFLLVIIAMFIVEACFAWYMLSEATSPGATVYFVADEPAHRNIMVVTTLCVVALAVYLIFFSRRWLYGRATR